jgi:hypothetical protein
MIWWRGLRIPTRGPTSRPRLGANPIAARSSRWVAPTPSRSDAFLFETTTGTWTVRLLTRSARGQIVCGALAREGSVRGEELKDLTARVMADPEQQEAALALARTMPSSDPGRESPRVVCGNGGSPDTRGLDQRGGAGVTRSLRAAPLNAVTSPFVVEFLQHRGGQLFDYAAAISGIAITSSAGGVETVSSSIEAAAR